MNEEEFWYLSNSVKRAREYGLVVEFWMFYKTYRDGGESVFQACNEALWEWDL